MLGFCVFDQKLMLWPSCPQNLPPSNMRAQREINKKLPMPNARALAFVDYVEQWPANLMKMLIEPCAAFNKTFCKVEDG